MKDLKVSLEQQNIIRFTMEMIEKITKLSESYPSKEFLKAIINEYMGNDDILSPWNSKLFSEDWYYDSPVSEEMELTFNVTIIQEDYKIICLIDDKEAYCLYLENNPLYEFPHDLL